MVKRIVRAAVCALGVSALGGCGGAAGDRDPSAAGVDPSSATATIADGGGAQVRHGGADAGGAAWDSGAPSDVYPAPHPPMPRMVSQGGTAIASPRFVAVTFGDDPWASAIDQFVAQIGQSAFWQASTAEYGVGAATAGAPIAIMEALPKTIDDGAIQRWLRTKLDGAHAGWPDADASTIVTLFYPAGVTIDLDGYASCSVFGGYHSEVTIGDVVVPYAVIPRCATFADVHGFDVVTVAASHELLEAATDPRPFSQPTYAGPDDDHLIWGLFTGGETGDMCTFNAGAFFMPADLPYTVQRAWSNASAAAGHDPCAPSLARETYFIAAPVLNDTVLLEGRRTKGAHIPVGGSGTIELALYSDGPTAPFEVSAEDLSELAGGPRVLDFHFDRTRGVNGERLHLTIDVIGIDAELGGEGFVVVSELAGQKSYWYGFVGN